MLPAESAVEFLLVQALVRMRASVLASALAQALALAGVWITSSLQLFSARCREEPILQVCSRSPSNT